MIKRLIISNIKKALINESIKITLLCGNIIQQFFKIVYTFFEKCVKMTKVLIKRQKSKKRTIKKLNNKQ